MFEIVPNWHPIFVHFSVALLSSAAILHLLSHFVTNVERANQCALVGRWNLWLGAGLTAFTLAAGWFAYNTVDHDAQSHAAMKVHRDWALATTAVFFTIVAWEAMLQRRKRGRSWLFTGFLLGASGLLVTTAWHGGELVYRYGLGVMSPPKAEGEGHAHDHGEGHAHAEGAAPEAGHSHGHDDDSGGEPHAQKPAGNTDESAQREAHAHPPGTPPHQD
jgi:uncharacterized membrane protein